MQPFSCKIYDPRKNFNGSSTKKSTEKAQLNAMPKSFYLRLIKFPMRITVKGDGCFYF